MISLKSNYFFQVVLISSILLAARILWVVFYEAGLYSEEAQYWLWSRHLDLSYYSKPPLVAYFNFISTSILGDSELGVRINAIITGFFLPLVVFRFAMDLFKNERIAFLSAIILMVLPFYNTVSLFFTTDPLVLLFFLLAQMFFCRALKQNHTRWWILGGCSLGLALLSKYTAVLFYPGILLFAYLFERSLFKKRGFYLFLLIPALFSIPMAIWIIEHDFISVRHVASIPGSGGNLDWIKAAQKIGEYLGSQVLSLSPFILIPGIFLGIRKKEYLEVRRFKKEIWFLLIPLMVIGLVFLFLAPKRTEFNWLFFGYGSVPVLLGYIFGKLKFFSVLKVNIGLTVGILLLILLPRAIDALGLSAIYPAKSDTLNRMYGWGQLGEEVTSLISQHNPENVFIFSNSYHIAAQLAFNTEGKPQTYCINLGRRMNQFDLWPGIEQFENQGYDAVYVSDKQAPTALLDAFNELAFKSELSITYRQSYQKGWFIYYLKDFKAFKEKKADTY